MKINRRTQKMKKRIDEQSQFVAKMKKHERKSAFFMRHKREYTAIKNGRIVQGRS